MNWLNLTIVYLACGMPFAVYRFVLSESGAAETAIRSIRAGILWPLDGGKATVKRLRSATRAFSKPRFELIGSEIEKLLAAERADFRPFDFREVFDRYIGLMNALRPQADPAVINLFPIMETDVSAATKACLGRSIRLKTERHVASARDQFLRYVAASSSRRVVELATALADDLSDSTLAADLTQRGTNHDHLRRPSLPRLFGSAS
jgi:hypothetical protein